MRINARDVASLLMLNGASIGEPVAAYGHFVMNRKTEITQAIDDYHSGPWDDWRRDGGRKGLLRSRASKPLIRSPKAEGNPRAEFRKDPLFGRLAPGC